MLITLDFDIDATNKDILTSIAAALVKDGYSKGVVGWEKDFSATSDREAVINQAKVKLLDIIQQVATQYNLSIKITRIFITADVVARKCGTEPMKYGVCRQFCNIQIVP